MKRFLVDINVIVDILTRDPEWFDAAAETLVRCASEGPLAINPIIYAELSVGFPRVEVLDSAAASASTGGAAAHGRAPCPISTSARTRPWTDSRSLRAT